MTKIKLCGLSCRYDIEAANELKPEYIGFVFAPKSKRYVSKTTAAELKHLLSPDIQAVGVFVNETPDVIADYLNHGIIDLAQLHGSEDEEYIRELRRHTSKPIIKAYRINAKQDIDAANRSTADFVLLDSGGGTGEVFDWEFIHGMRRFYFLAGGLGIGNVERAMEMFSPYAVDVSSGVETDGVKDKKKMAEFISVVRKEGKRG